MFLILLLAAVGMGFKYGAFGRTHFRGILLADVALTALTAAIRLAVPIDGLDPFRLAFSFIMNLTLF